jgi:hypothetical protein
MEPDLRDGTVRDECPTGQPLLRDPAASPLIVRFHSLLRLLRVNRSVSNGR